MTELQAEHCVAVPRHLRELGDRAFHVRRRLSAREMAVTGPVADIRGTPEARERARGLGPMLRYAPPEVLIEELGDDPP